jgi:hypothetical protein
MRHGLPVSLWRLPVLVSTFALPLATVAQVDGAGTQDTKLTLAEEQDSYEIYSMLLRTEVGPEWKIAAWAIKEQTQTFPVLASSNDDHLRQCLSVSQDQKSIYQPLIQGYLAKNQKKLVLERKFDLPQYALVGFGRTSGRANAPVAASIVFEVSAVGFNRDRTRALVYVGHHCGSLCGSGGYHLLVKKDGKWQVDREYRGVSCLWGS